MKIYEILETIRTKPVLPGIGICGNFDEVWFESSESDTPESIRTWEHSVNAFDQALKLWPGHSGSELFPVPCPDHTDPAIAYRDHWRAGTMWDGSEYALNRIKLLDWLIAHFRELDK